MRIVNCCCLAALLAWTGLGVMAGDALAEPQGAGGGTMAGKNTVKVTMDNKELAGQRSPGSKIVESMQFPELSWQVPQVREAGEWDQAAPGDVLRCELDNGVKVFLRPDGRAPIIRMNLKIRGGYLNEPLEKYSLNAITAELMRMGGTREMAPAALEEYMEVNGIDLELSGSRETSSLNLAALSSKFPEALHLASEVVRYPAYDEHQREIIMENYHELLRRQNDKPEGILSREFRHMMYGNDPQGRRRCWKHLSALTPQDIRTWHDTFWTPDKAYIAVAGDFEPKEMLELLRQNFGDWKPSGLPVPPVPEAPLETAVEPGYYLAAKDINQSNVCFGHLGISRAYANLAGAEALDCILGGGGFSSRLMDVIRNREGLAYSVFSNLELFNPRRGVFSVIFQTKSESTRKAIDLAIAEVERISREEVTQKELDQAKNSLINALIFSFDEPMKTARNFMSLEVLGMPRDFYEKRLEALRALTVQDVSRAARDILRPGKLVVLVVGNPEPVKACYPQDWEWHELELPEEK